MKVAESGNANNISEKVQKSGDKSVRIKQEKHKKHSFVCETCGKAFSSPWHLKEHKIIHTGEYPHRCSLCNKGFRRLSELNVHTKRHKDNKKIYKNRVRIPNQKVAEIGNANNTSEKVQQSQDKSVSIKQEKQNKHSFVCETCGKAFKSFWSMNEHMMIHTGRYPHRCSLCNKGFRRRSEFILHLKRHDANKKIYKSNLQTSESRHKELKVQNQNQKVSDVEDSSNVTKKVQKSTNKLVSIKLDTKKTQSSVCKMCGKVFSSQWHLKEHMMIHTRSYPHRCSLCNKGIRRPGELILHMKRHIDNKRINKYKVRIAELKQELHSQAKKEVEMGDTINISSRVQRSTDEPVSTKQEMKNRQSTVCETCGKAFSSLGHLKEHMMIHTGDYPHKCSLCNKDFRQPGELMSHFKHHFPNQKKYKTSQQPNNEKATEVHKESKLEDVKNDFYVTKFEIEEEHDVMDGDEAYHAGEMDAGNNDVIFQEEQNPLASDQDCQTGILESEKQCFMCPKCDRSYVQRSYLIEHLLRHEGEYPIRCGWCMKGFFRPREVIRHFRKVHSNEIDWEYEDVVPHPRSSEEKKPGEADVQGNIGTKEISGGPDFVRKKGPPFVCDHCDKIFGTKFQLELHVVTHLKQKLFKCQACKAVFLKETELEQHIECSDDCDKVRNTPSTHQTSQKSFQMYSCEQKKESKSKVCSICGRAFTRVQSCTMHMKTHFKSKRVHQCSLCNKTYKSGTSLKEHNDRYHRDSPRYTCQICGIGLWNDSSFRFHMNKHNGKNRIKRFHCDLCPKGFAKKSKFKAHMARHTGNCDFQCFTCGKMFPERWYLRKHEREHTGEKRFSCRFCDQTFAKRKTQQDHERRHTGEKPYKCGTCDKAFTQYAGLYVHQKTHERERKTSENEQDDHM